MGRTQSIGELDERKLKILQAVIKTYLETGEPVGSRTISKDTDLNLSSATIRNEMSDLEDMGYILQPHTSAGRIPSDKGYRLYVDNMLEKKTEEVQNLKEELEKKSGKIDVLLKEVAKVLANNTNYATMVSGPRYSTKKVKFIQLSAMDSENLLAVVVLDNNHVKNEMIRIDRKIDEKRLVKLNYVLNTALNGLDVTDMNIAVIQQIKEQIDTESDVVDSVLSVIGKTLMDQEDPEIYTSGATNILKYPELTDASDVEGLLNAFEEKNVINNWLELPANSQLPKDESHDIQVYIGDETQVESMKNCSMVTATYRIHEGVYGKIGIVGPKRMNYDKVVGTLQSLMGQLDDIFKKE